ncbi:Uncharacterized protein TCM_005419 [Theobroma cacao]|uniref:Uncharacterized protein n=1 Tax=Theobroma cacao TaxID=3641 RepID=A0A061DTL9_THECC|nr:Uncharacterized protein TCM_005419 [Theobroma cacao]
MTLLVREVLIEERRTALFSVKVQVLVKREKRIKLQGSAELHSLLRRKNEVLRCKSSRQAASTLLLGYS